MGFRGDRGLSGFQPAEALVEILREPKAKVWPRARAEHGIVPCNSVHSSAARMLSISSSVAGTKSVQRSGATFRPLGGRTP